MSAKRNDKETGLFSDIRCHGRRSVQDIRGIRDRIKSAPENSPIIVYKGGPEYTYTGAFGATIVGQEDLEKGYSKDGERVLGCFHRGSNDAVVCDVLRKAWGGDDELREGHE